MDTTEAERWFAAYLADFVALGRGDIEVSRILDHYGVPMIVSTDEGTQFLTDEEQVLAVMRRQLDGLRAEDYDRTEQLAGETTALNRSSALHRGRFARLRADGSEVARVDISYLITDGTAGRRISALIVH